MTRTIAIIVIAGVAFALGAAAASLLHTPAAKGQPAPRVQPSVEALTLKVWEMEVEEAERELREALKRDPADRDAITRFTRRVKNASDPMKEHARPFGSL
jgi:hypothetical protein